MNSNYRLQLQLQRWYSIKSFDFQMDKQNETQRLNALATNFGIYQARHSQSIYLQVVSKNFEIIRGFMAKFNLLYTKQETFETKLEEYFNRLQKVQRDQMNIHHQFRTANMLLESKGKKISDNKVIHKNNSKQRRIHKIPSLDLGFISMQQDELQYQQYESIVKQSQIQRNNAHQKHNTKIVYFDQNKNIENQFKDDIKLIQQTLMQIQYYNGVSDKQSKGEQTSKLSNASKNSVKQSSKSILKNKDQQIQKQISMCKQLQNKIQNMDQRYKLKIQKLQNIVIQCLQQIKGIQLCFKQLDGRVKQSEQQYCHIEIQIQNLRLMMINSKKTLEVEEQVRQITSNQKLLQKKTESKFKDFTNQLEEINIKIQNKPNIQEVDVSLTQLKNQIFNIKIDHKLSTACSSSPNHLFQPVFRRSFSSKARNSLLTPKNRCTDFQQEKYNTQSQKIEKYSVTMKQWKNKVKNALNKKPLIKRKIN